MGVKTGAAPPCCLLWQRNREVRVSYRHWHGPVVGLTVSQLWQGHAARLFISFGKLAPVDYLLPDGSRGAPRGEFELTNMDSYSDWELSLNGRPIATAESRYHLRSRSLLKLCGRRLQTLEVDAVSRSTRLTFSRNLVLTTLTYPWSKDRRPHWLLRLPTSNDDWPSVVLLGTSVGTLEEHDRRPRANVI